MRDWLFDVGIPLGFLVLAPLAGLWFLLSCVGDIRAGRRAVRVEAVVTDLRTEVREAESTTRGVSYAPVFEFRTKDGRLVQTVSSVASNPPVGQPGQRVRVAYDPDNPTDAWVPGPMLVLLLAKLAGVLIAALLTVVGINLLR